MYSLYYNGRKRKRSFISKNQDNSKKELTRMYNYVILGSGGFYQVAYGDLNRLDNVAYFEDDRVGFDGWTSKIRLRLCLNMFVNRYFKNPFKQFVYPRLFPCTFPENKPLCFIFFGCRYSLIESSYIQYLKSVFPDCRVVLYLQDIVASNSLFNIGRYREIFDMIISYDKEDSRKYHLLYFPTPYSNYQFSITDSEEKYDLYFCGKGKNRLGKILSVFQQAKNAGLKCKFFITEVNKRDQQYVDDIVYNTQISYLENLRYLQNCKCIVEVMQDGAVGYSPRMWEAIMYDKHLLTNNSSVSQYQLYSDKFFHFISEKQCFDWIDTDVEYSLQQKESLSPIHLLTFIERNFTILQ